MRERRPERNFPQHLAAFSLYVPFAAMLVGLFAGGLAKEEPETAIGIAWFNVTLIVLGFLAGIVALSLMRRVGRKGVLWLALGGIILNGVLISVNLRSILGLFR